MLSESVDSVKGWGVGGVSWSFVIEVATDFLMLMAFWTVIWSKGYPEACWYTVADHRQYGEMCYSGEGCDEQYGGSIVEFYEKCRALISGAL